MASNQTSKRNDHRYLWVKETRETGNWKWEPKLINLWDAANMVLKGKFIALKTSIRKERVQISDLRFKLEIRNHWNGKQNKSHPEKLRQSKASFVLLKKRILKIDISVYTHQEKERPITNIH